MLTWRIQVVVFCSYFPKSNIVCTAGILLEFVIATSFSDNSNIAGQGILIRTHFPFCLDWYWKRSRKWMHRCQDDAEACSFHTARVSLRTQGRRWVDRVFRVEISAICAMCNCLVTKTGFVVKIKENDRVHHIYTAQVDIGAINNIRTISGDFSAITTKRFVPREWYLCSVMLTVRW